VSYNPNWAGGAGEVDVIPLLASLPQSFGPTTPPYPITFNPLFNVPLTVGKRLRFKARGWFSATGVTTLAILPTLMIFGSPYSYDHFAMSPIAETLGGNIANGLWEMEAEGIFIGGNIVTGGCNRYTLLANSSYKQYIYTAINSASLTDGLTVKLGISCIPDVGSASCRVDYAYADMTNS
jgi:hypothetical protein